MSARHQQQGVTHLMLDHYRAAQIVMQQYGARGESEILQHIADMLDQDDREGAHLWLCVLAAYDELQRTQPGMTVLH